MTAVMVGVLRIGRCSACWSVFRVLVDVVMPMWLAGVVWSVSGNKKPRRSEVRETR